MLESPLMECDAIERHLNIPHSSVPVLCTLLDNKTGSSHHVKDSLHELKDKARLRLMLYDDFFNNTTYVYFNYLKIRVFYKYNYNL